MKILHLAPNYMPVNNTIRHGGTERIVYNLANIQVKEKSNKVFILGMEGSFVENTICKSIYPKEIQQIRLVSRKKYDDIMADKNIEILKFIQANNIDIIHDHFGEFTTSSEARELLSNNSSIKILVSIYGLPENPYYKDIYYNLRDVKQKHNDRIACYCVSQDHMELFSKAHLIDGFVYNGVDSTQFYLSEIKEDYYLSFASLVKEKGHDRCLKWAKENNKKLLIVGKSDEKITNEKFKSEILNNSFSGDDLIKNNRISVAFNNILNLLNEHGIVYLESVPELLKRVILSKAKGLFMLIRWREPFAVTVLESLASGTPIIASNIGSMKEVIDKETGVIINDDNEISNAVKQIEEISPVNCRRRVLRLFDHNQMAQEYYKAYSKLLKVKLKH